MNKSFPVAFALAAVVIGTSWGVLGQAAAMRGAHAGARSPLSAREKLELSLRLRAAVSEPARITRGDVSAARKGHGEDAAKLFETLRRSGANAR